MMKITVKIRLIASISITLLGLGLTGCGPIALPQLPTPQTYSAPIPEVGGTIPEQHHPVAVSRPVPAAGQLPQPRATETTGQQLAYAPQNRQVAVPPQINPVREVPQARRATPSRPSASVSRQAITIPRSVPNKMSPQSKTYEAPPKVTASPRPSASVKKEPPPEVKTIEKKAETPAIWDQEAEKEVLDMSKSAQKRPNDAAVSTNKPKTKPTVLSPSYSSSPAVSVLVKQANNQLSVGKTARAADTLERALRIAPDNPMLWIRLAEVNEQQGNKTQAASMARKAIALAPDDENLKLRGQRLIN